MAPKISIVKATGKWAIRAAGAVIGESSNALELTEGDYAPVIYIPKSDIAMAFLDLSETTTTCPHKGTATHYNLEAKSGTMPDAAWSYEDPIEAVAEIKGHLAFYPDKVTVEKL
ncbi:DUF427 domain-containing protein [Alphaproteobacteria bacterium KMM 3653]|uniref:DUF427 domain-containing protein n=1 Tax=Harenicola maris TaxID=2841044 RepID=A0AAP2CR97_9RHOB|nr:DUF427 domain-containing protein [Harenicola maris]